MQYDSKTKKGGENMLTTNQILQKNNLWLAIMIAVVLGMVLIPTVSFATLGANCTTDAQCGAKEECGGLNCSGDEDCICVSKPDTLDTNTDDDSTDPFGITKTETGLKGTLAVGEGGLIGTVTSIINVALGLLGIVAVVIILIGGFKWMTGGGNEDKVAEARKLIFAGIIGLAIILSAWAIAKFVIESLQTATGSGL